MEIPKIVQELLDKKAEMSNTVDLDAYANGLLDMYQALQLKQTGVIKSVCGNCERKQLYIKKQCYCGYYGDRLKT